MGKLRQRSEDGRLEQKWNARYRELEAFKAEHGHCNVPVSHGPLGGWVHSQRGNRKKGKLREERVQNLDDLGFNWAPLDASLLWDERLDELRKYKAEHGHCSVPRSDDRRMAAWVNTQRTTFKTGKLSEERVRRLDDLGFEWRHEPYIVRVSVAGDPRASQGSGQTTKRTATWDERLDELIKYKTLHGYCCDVPQSQGSLGSWVNRQRATRQDGKLSEERVQKLDDIGFNWGAVRGSSPKWNVRLVELMEYKTEHGDCDVPQSQGGWVNYQRRAQKTGRLSKERVKKLDHIGFKWRSKRHGLYPCRNTAVGGKKYEELKLKEYPVVQGGWNVPQSHGPYKWNDRYRESAAFSNWEASGHVGVQPAQSFSQQQRQHGLGSVPQSQVYSGGWVYHQRSNSWVYSHYTARKTARNLDDLHFDWENRWEAVKCDNPLDQLMKFRQP